MEKRVVLVSGGTSGIGLATVFQLLENGFFVSTFGPDAPKCAQLRRRLAKKYDKKSFLVEVGDVSTAKGAKAATDRTAKKFKRIDALVNNAGVWIEGPLSENSFEQIEKVIRVNALGTILLTRSVLPIMKKNGQGIIINVISQAGFYAKPNRSVYNASKWAITGFTKSLQGELEGSGIRVSGIYPGKVNTPLFEKQSNDKDMSNALQPESVAALISYMLSLEAGEYLPEVGIKFA